MSPRLVNVCVCVLVWVSSLVAPVQADADVSLDVPTLVLGQVTCQQLPPQVDELQHDVAELEEHIHLVLLGDRRTLLFLLQETCDPEPSPSACWENWDASPDQTTQHTCFAHTHTHTLTTQAVCFVLAEGSEVIDRLLLTT